MDKNQSAIITGESGFSMAEMLVVLAVISIMTGISLFYLVGNQKAYRADDQALLLVDMFQEARQRSLTQVETMRVEISVENNRARLIDENLNTTADDDVVLKEIPFFDPSQVTYRQRPSNIPMAENPPELFPVNDAVFVPSVYPTSPAQSVATFRFLRSGQVHNAGNNATGAGSTPVGTTFHLWAPKKVGTTFTNDADIARAITIIGSSGVIRLWEWDWNITDANKWKDSRRFGTYGGAATPSPSPTP